ncbi:MAG TPA: hypothetical protein VK147_01635 [Candidatus Didemnitutus sp.]|nr:hypothetical protein [Candidatus Didemnitutus sp.]
MMQLLAIAIILLTAIGQSLSKQQVLDPSWSITPPAGFSYSSIGIRSFAMIHADTLRVHSNEQGAYEWSAVLPNKIHDTWFINNRENDSIIVAAFDTVQTSNGARAEFVFFAVNENRIDQICRIQSDDSLLLRTIKLPLSILRVSASGRYVALTLWDNMYGATFGLFDLKEERMAVVPEAVEVMCFSPDETKMIVYSSYVYFGGRTNPYVTRNVLIPTNIDSLRYGRELGGYYDCLAGFTPSGYIYWADQVREKNGSKAIYRLPMLINGMLLADGIHTVAIPITMKRDSLIEIFDLSRGTIECRLGETQSSVNDVMKSWGVSERGGVVSQHPNGKIVGHELPMKWDATVIFTNEVPDSVKEHHVVRIRAATLPIDPTISIELVVDGELAEIQPYVSLSQGSHVITIRAKRGDSVIGVIESQIEAHAIPPSVHSLWIGSIDSLSSASISPSGRKVSMNGALKAVQDVDEGILSLIDTYEIVENQFTSDYYWRAGKTAWAGEDCPVFIEFTEQTWLGSQGAYWNEKYTKSQWYSLKTGAGQSRQLREYSTDLEQYIESGLNVIEVKERGAVYIQGWHQIDEFAGIRLTVGNVNLQDGVFNEIDICGERTSGSGQPRRAELALSGGPRANWSIDPNSISIVNSSNGTCTFQIPRSSSRLNYTSDGEYLVTDSLVFETKNWTIAGVHHHSGDNHSIPHKKLVIGSNGSNSLVFYTLPSFDSVGTYVAASTLNNIDIDTSGRRLLLHRRDRCVEIVQLDSILQDLGLLNMVSGVSIEQYPTDSNRVKLSPLPARTWAKITLDSPLDTEAIILISNSMGHNVASLILNSGGTEFTWNLTSESGLPVAPGMYGFLLRSQDGRILESGTFIVAPE